MIAYFANGAVTAAMQHLFNAEGALESAAIGVKSFFRGVYRYARHESKLLGGYGLGEAIQASIVEQMLLGEAINLALHANQTMVNEGLEQMRNHKAMIAARQASAIGAGVILSGTGGPSFSLLAGMGDAYYSVEQLALQNHIFVTTVDANRPILPQLAPELRNHISNELEGLANILLQGHQ